MNIEKTHRTTECNIFPLTLFQVDANSQNCCNVLRIKGQMRRIRWRLQYQF